MTDLQLPQLGPRVAEGLRELSLDFQGGLPEEAVQELRKLTTQSDGESVFLAVVRASKINGRSVEVISSLAVLLDRELTGTSSRVRGYPLSLSFEVLASDGADSDRSMLSEAEAVSRWNKAFELVQGAVSLDTASVSGRLRFMLPLDAAKLLITLPIRFDPNEMTGFSQVSGVRLAQIPEEQNGEELYTVVLDQNRSHVFVDVTAPVELSPGASWLDAAAISTTRIARLAVLDLEADI